MRAIHLQGSGFHRFESHEIGGILSEKGIDSKMTLGELFIVCLKTERSGQVCSNAEIVSQKSPNQQVGGLLDAGVSFPLG